MQFKKVLLYSILTCSTILFSGCVNKLQQDQNVSNTYEKSKIIFQSNEIQNWLILEDLIYKKREDGLTQIEARFFNKNSFDDKVAYRIDWLDKDGFTISSLLSKWEVKEVYGNANLIIQAISPSIKAVDFSIKLRNPKYETTTVSDTQIQ